MKKLISIIVLALMAMPAVAFGAYNDVTLTAGTVIVTNGVTLDVYGSNAAIASITVNPTNFSFVLNAGSSIEVISPNRNYLAYDVGGIYLTTNTCSSAQSTLAFTAPGNASAMTITVSPSSSLCNIDTADTVSLRPSSGVSGGGGGGGGGYYRAPVVAPVVTKTPAVSASTAAAPATTGTGTAFTAGSKTLIVGSKSTDVSTLQKLLAKDPTIYPGGLVTGYFGSLTLKAVQAFQAKYGIVSSGTPSTTGYGSVGPKTKAMLQQVFGK